MWDFFDRPVVRVEHHYDYNNYGWFGRWWHRNDFFDDFAEEARRNGELENELRWTRERERARRDEERRQEEEERRRNEEEERRRQREFDNDDDNNKWWKPKVEAPVIGNWGPFINPHVIRKPDSDDDDDFGADIEDEQY